MRLFGSIIVVIGIISMIPLHPSNSNINLFNNFEHIVLMIENFLLAYNDSNILLAKKLVITNSNPKEIAFLIIYATSEYIPSIMSVISRILIFIGVIFIFSKNGLFFSTINALKRVIIAFIMVYLLSNTYIYFNESLSNFINIFQISKKT
jgi:hypothetical protein